MFTRIFTSLQQTRVLLHALYKDLRPAAAAAAEGIEDDSSEAPMSRA